MYLAILNKSADPRLTPALLDRIAQSLELQLYEDYAPRWQSAGVPVRIIKTLENLPAQASPIVIFDKPDDTDALAWHSYTPNGRIYGRAFLGAILEAGGTIVDGPISLSATLSHEALEAVEDPYVNALHMKDDQTLEWREICDRVEGDSYVKEGISVSNFLGPRAFRDGPGPYDMMGLLTDPWEIRPGGYCERLSLATGKVTTHWGASFPEWKKGLKTNSSRKTFKLAGLR